MAATACRSPRCGARAAATWNSSRPSPARRPGDRGIAAPARPIRGNRPKTREARSGRRSPPRITPARRGGRGRVLGVAMLALFLLARATPEQLRRDAQRGDPAAQVAYGLACAEESPPDNAAAALWFG